MGKPIKLEVHKAETLTGVVKLEPAAERKLKELCRETGLSARHVASQLIIQGADLVEIVEVN